MTKNELWTSLLYLFPQTIPKKYLQPIYLDWYPTNMQIFGTVLILLSFPDVWKKEYWG